MNVDGWCIMVRGGSMETWEIAREEVDRCGGGEGAKAVMKKG